MDSPPVFVFREIFPFSSQAYESLFPWASDRVGEAKYDSSFIFGYIQMLKLEFSSKI